jgi:pilus assembly protein CpaF
VNALSRLIPGHERIVTIEDAKELQIQQPNWVSMETVEPYEEGVPPVTIADLVKNSLRQTPDRIIVGEVRGEEALYLLRSFSSGHGGGFGTVHCNDAEDALHMLQFLAQMAPVSLAPSAVGLLVGRAVDVVVHQHYFEEEDGKRRVSEIIEVDHPNGAVVLPNGTVEFRYRRLVEWDPYGGKWVFVHAPSKALKRTIQKRGLPWPEASLNAPEREG